MMAGDSMDLLTVKEFAVLKGCSEQHIRVLIANGEIKVQLADKAANNRKQYLIPVGSLPAELQRKYYGQLKRDAGVLPAPKEPKLKAQRPQRPFEEYSANEREEIALWTTILQTWQAARSEYPKKTEADPIILGMLKYQFRAVEISLDILYRKWAAYKAGDLDGLIDKRGGWNRGQTGIPKEVWDAFCYYYFDDRRPSLSMCYSYAIDWTKEFHPEHVQSIPTERTFRRAVDTQIPKAVVKYLREGEKACFDECMPYIERLYDELEANDYWIADNHTMDIISMRTDGTEVTHRMSITAFMDAKTGIITGYNITDNPCSQSTLLALRNGIGKFGAPRAILFDNGSEFLTHDVAGRGHRTRKSQSLIDDPPTVLARLGIEAHFALVRNAKAKPIERMFGTFKGTISKLMDGYCGGTIMERPESLKYKLKKGMIPLDSQLRQLVGELIEGGYNEGMYGGKDKAGKGLRRIEFWEQSIRNRTLRKATEDDLNLLLARSTRYQKIKRNGVYIEICGEKLWYTSDDAWLHLDEEVYVRYDPADLCSVRIYDKATDKRRFVWQMSLETAILFNAQPDEVATAQERVSSTKKAVRQMAKGIRDGLSSEQRIDMLDLAVRKAHLAKEGRILQLPKRIEPIRPNEEPLQQVVGNDHEVVVDMAKMNRNAGKNRIR